jgi:hypothetical protein
MIPSDRSPDDQPVSVGSLLALRDAIDDLLAHTDGDDWHPLADTRTGGMSAEVALQRDADAFANALQQVIGEASHG